MSRGAPLLLSSLLTLTLAFACSSTSTGDAGAVDARADATAAADAAPRGDAAEPARDAMSTPPDAAPLPDATFPDAMSLPDAEPIDEGVADASEVDAGEVADAGSACQVLGQACESDEVCVGSGYACINGGCFPVQPDCGGFVMARCPANRPICLYYVGADYGPCFTVAERNCLCADRRTRALFPDCP